MEHRHVLFAELGLQSEYLWVDLLLEDSLQLLLGRHVPSHFRVPNPLQVLKILLLHDAAASCVRVPAGVACTNIGSSVRVKLKGRLEGGSAGHERSEGNGEVPISGAGVPHDLIFVFRGILHAFDCIGE